MVKDAQLEMSAVTDLLKGANLYLIGMMGSGKTTVGTLLAQQLGYSFMDTDTVIEQVTKQSIPDFFAQHGEAEFRRIETQVLEQVAAYVRMVIATGGGLAAQVENWSHLQHGIVVWLDVDPQTLYQRLQGDRTRPLLQAEDPYQRLTELLDQRRSRYSQADVTVTIPANESPEETAERVLEAVRSVLKTAPATP